MTDPFAWCETECYSDEGDYTACQHFHTEEDHEDFQFFVKAAYLSYGCEICIETMAISQEIAAGETPKRTCRKCQYLFDLDAENPYGDVLYDEDEGVYFECNGCFVLEEKRKGYRIVRKTHVSFDGQRYECVASDKENCDGDCTEPPPFKGFPPFA